jgi:hypothetical protein
LRACVLVCVFAWVPCASRRFVESERATLTAAAGLLAARLLALRGAAVVDAVAAAAVAEAAAAPPTRGPNPLVPLHAALAPLAALAPASRHVGVAVVPTSPDDGPPRWLCAAPGGASAGAGAGVLSAVASAVASGLPPGRGAATCGGGSVTLCALDASPTWGGTVCLVLAAASAVDALPSDGHVLARVAAAVQPTLAAAVQVRRLHVWSGACARARA